MVYPLAVGVSGNTACLTMFQAASGPTGQLAVV